MAKWSEIDPWCVKKSKRNVGYRLRFVPLSTPYVHPTAQNEVSNLDGLSLPLEFGLNGGIKSPTLYTEVLRSRGGVGFD